MASLNYVNGTGATTAGAIVGDTPNPYSATLLTAAPPLSFYLTSGALSKGDAGELGGLNDLTVEFWFQYDVAPGAIRTLLRGPEISAGNRQWGFEINTTGTIRFYVRNSVPTLFLITSGTALLPNIWYYIVGVTDVTGGLVRLYVNGTQEASTAWTAPVAASSFTTGDNGSMLVGDTNADATFQYDELAIYRRFIGASRVSAHYTAGTVLGRPTQTPGARMIDILDRSISDHAPRSLQAGSRSVTECYFAGQAPIEELLRADGAENVDAMLFVARDGTVTFLDAGHRSSAPYNTSQVTFGDAGGAEIAYEDFGMDYSEQFLVNEWKITRSQGRKTAANTGETQTFSDATSISKYLKQPQSQGDIPVIDDSYIATIGAALLAKFKDPVLRATTFSGVCNDPGFAEAFFRREIGDRITVKRTPPGGGARISQDFYIQSISIDGTPDAPWKASFGLSPL